MFQRCLVHPTYKRISPTFIKTVEIVSACLTRMYAHVQVHATPWLPPAHSLHVAQGAPQVDAAARRNNAQ
jgi:hypothetical protein